MLGLVVAVALAAPLLLGGCARTTAGQTPAASSGRPSPADSSSPAHGEGEVEPSGPPEVRTTGTSAYLLRAPRKVTISFRFLGPAPATWNWRVVGVYGGIVASGVESGAGAAQRVSWACTGSDGRRADPGEYLVRIGSGKTSHVNDLATVGWVRFQPPVLAHVYRRLPAAGRRVALTFDDGGGKTAWYWILRRLRDAHAKATFFPCGVYVGGYARRDAFLTVKDHMAIGNHTWSHQDLVAASDAQARSQIVRNDAAWWPDLRMSTVPYLRPPGGDSNARVLALAGELGYSRVIMWDVDSADVSNPGVDAIVRNVLDHVRDGSIILLHTRGKTPAALPRIISGLRRRHYQMVTLPQLFKSAGVR